MGKMIREKPGWPKPAWVKVRPDYVVAKGYPMPPEEFKAWVMGCMVSCMNGEREEGSDADRLLSDAIPRIKLARERAINAGKASAEARRVKAGDGTSSSTPSSTPSSSQLEQTKDEEEENQDFYTVDEDEPPMADGSVSSSDNSASFFSSSGNGIRQVEVGEVSEVTAHLLERMRMASNAELPGLMAAYCDEGGNQKTLNSWRKFIRVHGACKFRDAVIAYIYKSETEGEEPKNRGAAFNSFLKQQKEAVV